MNDAADHIEQSSEAAPEKRPIRLPEMSLVVLVGPSGSGKSTFAKEHFLPTEVLNSDTFRGLVSNDANDQSATEDAFAMLHALLEVRLRRGLLTVVDATNVQAPSRKPLVALARKYHMLPSVILFDLPEQVCRERNKHRDDRFIPARVLRHQRTMLRQGLRHLRREGFRSVYTFDSEEAVRRAVIERVPMWCDKRDARGPFDIIGDVHGCATELESLLSNLGYRLVPLSEPHPFWGAEAYAHPDGRQVIFVGDLVDRGPRVVDSLRIARNMIAHGSGFCVVGNHDEKLLRKLSGKNVKIAHGLAESLADIERVPEEQRSEAESELQKFLASLISHHVFDSGRLVVAHAGLREEMHGRGSGAIRDFAMYGETTGELDEDGLPVRLDWAADYRGDALVVYGHTPVGTPRWLNNTCNVDTGCVFGGELTALRYPERETVSVPANETYTESVRDFRGDAAARSAQAASDDVLDIADVTGKRIISTKHARTVTVGERNATAALEVMSRFAADPKWLIYLPPTMSPCEASREPGYLEHPHEALDYFRETGVTEVVCQEKHMGSRAVVVIARDADAAAERFGVTDGTTGLITTRTGRAFFDDEELHSGLLDRLRSAMTAANFWETFGTSWACFDCELMPWSAKAQGLLRSQYGAVGAAGRTALPEVLSALDQTAERLAGDHESAAQNLREQFGSRLANIERFTEAYRAYCWPVASLDDYRLAPFHLLATEGKVHTDQPHAWHLQTLENICQHDAPLLFTTDSLTVTLDDEASCARAVDWWIQKTEAGGEGMVVKPRDWINRSGAHLVQPAVKCRGKEYLRIIYGPDYDTEENLARLRNRFVKRKRSLAVREFALGIESLDRFIAREPLRRVHECVFGVLALESEPVDPRL